MNLELKIMNYELRARLRRVFNTKLPMAILTFIFNSKFLILNSALLAFYIGNAEAKLDWHYGRNTFSAEGTGHLGTINDYDAFKRYNLRLSARRLLPNRWNIGAVYGLDEFTADQGFWAKDGFLYLETGYGRIEAGWTESIATKMGLTLPDVGGTRINNAPFFLPNDFLGNTNPRVFGNQFAWRANMATMPTNPIQFGMGRTFWNQTQAGFNNSTDIALRYRKPDGRIKSSVSAGFAYVEKPRGFDADIFLPKVTANARYQGTLAGNIQWGSLLWAVTTKVTVDDNPDLFAMGFRGDGLQVGTGASYDILSLSFSANYIYSNVGIFGKDAKMINNHTGMVSGRYKIDQFFSVWASGGSLFSNYIGTNPFFSAGVTARF